MELRLLPIFEMSEDFFINDYIKQLRSLDPKIEDLCGARLKGFHINGNPKELYENYQDVKKEFEKHFIRETKENTIEIGMNYKFFPCEYFATYKDSELIGLISFRARLDERLLQRGGNIGYSIFPRYRNQGYGKEQLKLLLSYIKSKYNGYNSVFIDCVNIASENIVKANGGIFISRTIVHDSNSFNKVSRYIILLK